ncbi:MAG: aminotransferase class IV, partial [Salinisphaera sp.]|nr:aminotransferase class IV [Salinisphaera sp.]
APALLEQGAAAITRPDTRWARCDIKSTALLANILLADDAHREDAEEAILYRGENITEGSSSNVFAVCNGVVTTPPLGPTILAGITRAEVLRLAGAYAIACVEAALTRTDLVQASELWLTSSTRELLPVTRLDGAAVGDGRPGPQRARLQALLRPPSPA